MAEQKAPAAEFESKNEDLYSALDIEDYQIRILTILPDPKDSPIRCLLTTTSLLYPEPYTALSYCWGDPDTRDIITVNGLDFRATINLKYALRQLRTMGHYQVWADAICINQGDRQERSLQVRLMRQIFSKANQVLACVGTDSEINKEAMAILSQPACLHIGRHRHSGSLTSRLRIEDSKEPPEQEYLEDLKTRAERGKGRERTILDKFFRLPYWRRAWIIQEVTVAATVIIICGQEQMRWEMIANADAFYQESGCIRWSYVKQMIVFRDDYRRGARPGLLYAIDKTYMSLSTDPRDKIFALLGLCHDGEQLVPCPNYKQPLHEIARDFTIAIITKKRSLDYLALTHLRHETNKLSWVVDWFWLAPRAHISMISDSIRPVSDFCCSTQKIRML